MYKRQADNSKKIPTIPNSYINKVAEDIDNEYFYDGTYVDDWGHTDVYKRQAENSPAKQPQTIGGVMLKKRLESGRFPFKK